MRLKFFLIFLLLANLSFAQSNLDSLWSVWNDESKHDTTRLLAIGRVAWDGFLFTNPDSAKALAQIQLDFADKTNQPKFKAKALNIIGVSHYFKGDYAGAIESYMASHEIFLEIGLKGGAASTLNNIGLIYQEQGDYEKALEYTIQSKQIYEEMGKIQGIATAHNNIGLIYENQGAYLKAIENYSSSIRIHEELGNYDQMVNGLTNIGNIHKAQADYEKALEYYEKSLKILDESEDNFSKGNLLGNIGLTYLEMEDSKTALKYFNDALNLHEELKNKQGIANIYNNIALLYQGEKDYDKALEYYDLCLPIFEENEDQEGVAIVLNNVGSIYFDRGLKAEALVKCKKSLEIALNIGSSEQIRNASKTLWEIYKSNGDYKKSLEMHELYIDHRDSINSEENKKELFKQEIMMEHEKQIVADSIRNFEAQKLKDAELAKEKAENEKQKFLSYFLIGGLILMLLVAFFIFNRFRLTKAQKIIIEAQKNEVDLAYDQLEMKNKEIMDSIVYAKRIQSAILPSENYFKKHFPNSFILYKPKDIVAGDFYWLKDDSDTIMLAVADCTGHGVPGAMVSVICNHGLSHSVKDFQLKEPGKILDKTRELVLEEFEKSKDDVQDGMDVAFISLKYKYDKGEISGAEIQFSGAHNPIWIVKKDATELEEIKGSKQPIGRYEKSEPFPTHKIELEKGDCFYLTTDGFADQFGGEKGKKLKSKNFKDLILSLNYLPIEDQGKRLNEFFMDWGKEHEQIDDVCVIGVRL